MTHNSVVATELNSWVSMEILVGGPIFHGKLVHGRPNVQLRIHDQFSMGPKFS